MKAAVICTVLLSCSSPKRENRRDVSGNSNVLAKPVFTYLLPASVSEQLFSIVDRLKKIGYDESGMCYECQGRNSYQRFGKYANSLALEVTCVLAVEPDENPIGESKAVKQKAHCALRILFLSNF